MIAAVTAAVVGGVLLVAGPATAVQPATHTTVVSDDPVNTTPSVLDGEVRAIAEVGNIGIAGGTFTQVRTAASATAINRSNIFAYDITTGAVLSSFAPSVPGTVFSIEPAGDGQTVYIGGQFANVNGASRTSRVARINVTTGAVVSTFVSPGFNGVVKDLHLRNNKLYAGGTFTTAGTATRTLLVQLDPTTGAVDPNFNFTFGAPRNGGALQVIKFDITPDGSKLVAMGNFTTLNGLARYQIAMLNLSTSPPSVMDWQTTRFGNACASVFDTYMRDIDIDPTGSYFVVVTTGSAGGGVNAGVLCDTASRWNFGTTGSNQQPAWVDYTGGDTFWGVGVSGSAVYVGGHMRWFNNPYGSDSASQGAVAREGIAALDPRNGLPYSWNPGRTRGVGVFDLVATSRGLWVGSDTDRINGEYHGSLALMPLSGGTALPAEFTGTLPGTVYSLGTGGSNNVIGRAFNGTSVTGTTAVNAGGFAFGSTRAAFMIDGKLYTGMNNGTFAAGTLTVRSFDGTTFGTPTTVNLNALTDFANNDLKNLTGAFYDKATARLYYTVAGNSSLFYRYFEPESQIIGAVRFTSQASITGLNWSQVSSMFQSGSYLYVASSVDGQLRRYTWNSAAGTANADATVVGTGQDWRARGAFIYAPAGGGGPVNQAPTAVINSSCSGLVCQFTSSASSDPDGTIASVAWTFGDNATSGANNPAHTYGAAGTYPVTLTVTDNQGTTGTATASVTVAPVQANQIAFRAGAASSANSTTARVTIPSSVQVGDSLVLIGGSNTAGTLGTVAGWTQEADIPGSTMQTKVWSKVAAAGDAGSTITVPVSATAKTTLQVVAYSGTSTADPVSAVTSSVETATVAAHTTPAVTVPAAGSWLVSFWSDKSSATTTWTLPAGATQRSFTVGTGSGRMSGLIADSAGGVAAGQAGGLTATADSSNGKATMVSLVLAPA